MTQQLKYVKFRPNEPTVNPNCEQNIYLSCISHTNVRNALIKPVILEPLELQKKCIGFNKLSFLQNQYMEH